MKDALDQLYAGFNHPDSALDPVQIVRRYDAVADREVVGFLAAGLAFGRVASVMASVEAACRVLGSSPAAAIRAFDPSRDAARWKGFVHRWTTAADMTALCWTLRCLLERHGSLEQAPHVRGRGFTQVLVWIRLGADDAARIVDGDQRSQRAGGAERQGSWRLLLRLSAVAAVPAPVLSLPTFHRLGTGALGILPLTAARLLSLESRRVALLAVTVGRVNAFGGLGAGSRLPVLARHARVRGG